MKDENGHFQPMFIARRERIEALDKAVRLALDAAIEHGEFTRVTERDLQTWPFLRRCLVCGGDDGPATIPHRRSNPYYGKTREELIQRPIAHRAGCDISKVEREAKRLRGFPIPNWRPIHELERICAGLAEWCNARVEKSKQPVADANAFETSGSSPTEVRS